MARQFRSTILRDLAQHPSVITTKINQKAFDPPRGVHLAMDMREQRNGGAKDGSTAHPFDPDLVCIAQLSNIRPKAREGILLEEKMPCDEEVVRLLHRSLLRQLAAGQH